MPTYYCHNCAIKSGYLSNYYPSSPVGSSYQLEKYIKHTNPDPSFDYLSVFSIPSTDEYKNYVVSASCSGSVEIDNEGRRNIIYVAGKNIGASFKKGNFQRLNDTVKVVLSTEPNRIHAFTESSTKYLTGFCSLCNRPIVY